MTVLARPNHPMRLAGVFAFSVLAFGLVAAAAGAVLYIIDSERSSRGVAAPQANVELPPGMVLIRRVDNVAVWKDELGFKPVLAEVLPDDIADIPMLYLQQPDADGRRAGHVRYAHSDGSPALTLIEQQGKISSEPAMKTEESSAARAHIQTFTCGTLVIQAQVYFQSGPAQPSLADSTAVAEDIVAGLRDQCG